MSKLVITMTKSTFTRTESGKGWRKRPVEVQTETIDETNYHNRTDRGALKMLCGWWPTGDGCNFVKGWYRIERGYTCYGYVPTHITYVSPWGDRKYKEDFKFEYVEEDENA